MTTHSCTNQNHGAKARCFSDFCFARVTLSEKKIIFFHEKNNGKVCMSVWASRGGGGGHGVLKRGLSSVSPTVQTGGALNNRPKFLPGMFDSRGKRSV